MSGVIDYSGWLLYPVTDYWMSRPHFERSKKHKCSCCQVNKEMTGFFQTRKDGRGFILCGDCAPPFTVHYPTIVAKEFENDKPSWAIR